MAVMIALMLLKIELEGGYGIVFTIWVIVLLEIRDVRYLIPSFGIMYCTRNLLQNAGDYTGS